MSKEKDTILGTAAQIRESTIYDFALENPELEFSAESVCRKVYQDRHPNQQFPAAMLGAFHIACLDLVESGHITLSRVMHRKKGSYALYKLQKEQTENV